MRRLFSVAIGTILVAALVSAGVPENNDQDIYWQIRHESINNSQILRTMHVLTDVDGPRLTGSPNLKAAAEWAITQMQTWGLKNGHLEPWDFGHPGWRNERLSAHIVSPVQDHLVTEALAWTPGTNGPVRAPAVQITLPPRPTLQELTAHLEPFKSTVAGRIVLVGTPQRVLVTFNPAPPRRDDSDVLAQFDPARAGPPPGGPPQAQQPAPREGALRANQVDEQVNQFLLASGALLRVNDAGRDHGQIRAFSNRTYDTTKAPPTVVMRNEDYGRISRLLADGRAVELEFDIVNRTYPEARAKYT